MLTCLLVDQTFNCPVNNLYLVLIVRARTKFDSELNTSFSVDCIYEMVKLDGIERTLIPYYNFPDLGSADYIDCVLTEDKTAGRQFFEKLYNGKSVFSAKSGKNTIIQDILNICGLYNSVLAVIDKAAFGQYAEEMQNKIFKKYNNVFLIPRYECFEELLLHTNFFSDDEFVTEVLINPSEFANSKLSWENYFEELINIVTKKKPYRHTHSTDQLFKCYWMSCDHEQSCDRYIKNKCFKKLKGNKFIWMLSGTKYEILLGFCDKNHNLDENKL